jgi:hypothetical protein
MSFVEAAAFPRSGLVAYQTLVHDLKVWLFFFFFFKSNSRLKKKGWFGWRQEAGADFGRAHWNWIDCNSNCQVFRMSSEVVVGSIS